VRRRKVHTAYDGCMKKSKLFANPKSFVSSILPARTRLHLLRSSVEKTCHAPQLVFPFAADSFKRALVIAPCDPLWALHQLACVISITAHCKGAHVTVMCERRVTPFFRTIAGIAEFIEYDDEARYLFSTEFERIGHDVRDGHYDLCVMLEPSPDLPLLYIAGQSAAAVRVGFVGAGDYPFLNLHVSPSQSTTNISDRSALVASVLGMPARARTQWSVAKEATEEVGHLLRETGVDPGSRLIGIDGEYFFRQFGKSWTQSLIDMLQTKQRACYFYSFGLPEPDSTAWMERQGLPVFSSIGVPRSAALVDRSEFVVAGPGVLFELADLLKTPVAGVFTSEEFDMLCRESDTTKGLRIASGPDDATIASVERIVDARLSSR